MRYNGVQLYQKCRKCGRTRLIEDAGIEPGLLKMPEWSTDLLKMPAWGTQHFLACARQRQLHSRGPGLGTRLSEGPLWTNSHSGGLRPPSRFSRKEVPGGSRSWDHVDHEPKLYSMSHRAMSGSSHSLSECDD